MNGDSPSDSLETIVLVNILGVLKRMDSKMELQAKRLEILEITGSLRSTSSGDTAALSEPPLSSGQSSGRATIVSEVGDSEESNLKYHFMDKPRPLRTSKTQEIFSYLKSQSRQISEALEIGQISFSLECLTQMYSPCQRIQAMC